MESPPGMEEEHGTPSKRTLSEVQELVGQNSCGMLIGQSNIWFVCFLTFLLNYASLLTTHGVY